ncbi:AAA family ATPase [Pontibacter sp. G13]|uniref:AAA family ATPase n=1 Tax=Pontibacter sp. G13 TaxID=3074898 RepID=UPI0028895444|nr:AAA family ATPase [Pontibacter sp. G13]WNJ18685.1 AAA family ATPase [Pontibacter sp. G13]
MRIHILGASGSGTTTLGQALAAELQVRHLDADHFYWKRTDPPFTTKIPPDIRQQNMIEAFRQQSDVVVSGSMVSWGDYWHTAFDMVVFIHIPPELRMERLRKREFQRYGSVIYDDPERNRQYLAFMEWAAQYDDPAFTGRSFRIHQEWMEKVSCPVLRITGDTSVQHRVNRVKAFIAEMD